MPNQEVLRESVSPVPAQKAARLPYETPPLQILVDPSDPNIDLGTQLGFGENTFFSSRLKPGRSMPTDLGISHHVLDYRMDQMAQEPERLARQPIPPSLLQRAGETLRRVAPPALIPATALGVGGAAVITIVQPHVPSAEASGNRMLVTAGSTGTGENCDNGDYVLQTDPVFAGKIASGKVLIGSGDGLAAAQGAEITEEEPVALVEGQLAIVEGEDNVSDDTKSNQELQSPAPQTPVPSGEPETAVIVPAEEAWEELVDVVPKCPPLVVKPTPTLTPRETPRPTPKIKSVDTFLRTKTKVIDATTTEGFIKKWVASDQLIKDGYNVNNVWGSCKDGDKQGDPYSAMADACQLLTTRAYERYKQTGNMKAYKAALSVRDYAITHIPNAYGFKGQLSDYMHGIFG